MWSQSFDKLMRNPAGRNVFREFLRTEYSEENMLFWLACEDLKQEINKSAIEEKARSIYEDYISILSPKEVKFLLTTWKTPKGSKSLRVAVSPNWTAVMGTPETLCCFTRPGFDVPDVLHMLSALCADWPSDYWLLDEEMSLLFSGGLGGGWLSSLQHICTVCACVCVSIS